jgi:DnaD/phage-associated family protein
MVITVQGDRMRNISGNRLFTDEFFGTLKPLHRLLWLGMILIADDQGRLEDGAALMCVLLFPYDKDVVKDIEKGLALFETKHKIVRYVSGNNGSGKALIQIVNWWKHQSPQWAKESQYPAPRNWIDRVCTHKEGLGSQLYKLNWEKAGGFISATKPLPSGKLTASLPQASRDIDIDSLKDLSSLSASALDFFSKDTGKIKPDQIAEMKTLLADGVLPGWVDDAIAIALSKSKNKHNAHYIIGILKNWKLEGRNNDRKLSKAKTPAKPHRRTDTPASSQPNDRTKQAAELVSRKRRERARQTAAT